MTFKLCMIMDPLHKINLKKDTSFALLLEAQKRGWEIFYLETPQLFIESNKVYAQACRIQVQEEPSHCITFLETATPYLLNYFDAVWIRKDPPFDIAYLYATYLLEIAQNQGAFIINSPTAIRNFNEKLLALKFPQCCPPTLVTSEKHLIKNFLVKHQKIIVKPLHAMGGQGIFLLNLNDPNFNVTIEMLSRNKYPIMAQRYLPEIKNGDKRILMLEGIPISYALARIPPKDDIRGNLAVGGTGIAHTLTERDHWLCAQIGPFLKQQGMFFVGIDVIGDYLTEINITSPTCVREIEILFKINIRKNILDCLLQKANSLH